MTEIKITLEERLGQGEDTKETIEERVKGWVEYDPVTGDYKKKPVPLIEVDEPGSEYWTPMGTPRRDVLVPKRHPGQPDAVSKGHPGEPKKY